MSSNPFEPPRTTDLDAIGMAAPGGRFLSTEATQELAAAAPWVRWLTRVMSASIAVGIIKTFLNLVRSEGLSGKVGKLLGLALSTGMAIMILRALRRYAEASDRLRAGAHQAAGQVIDAQASYFRLLGTLAVTVGILLGVVLLLVLAALLLSR